MAVTEKKIAVPPEKKAGRYVALFLQAGSYAGYIIVSARMYHPWSSSDL